MRFRVFCRVLLEEKLSRCLQPVDPSSETLLILNVLALNHDDYDDCLWMMIRTMNASLNLSAQNFVHLEDIVLLLPVPLQISLLSESVSVDGVTDVPLHRIYVGFNGRRILY